MAEPKSGDKVPLDLLPDNLKPKAPAAPKSGDKVPLDLLPDDLKPPMPTPADREITLPEETIFASKEAFRKAIAENLSWAGLTPEFLAQQGTQQPTATIEAAKPVEEESGFRTFGRLFLPKAFGIEEGLLGPDPDEAPTYDKAKVEADIARYKTIKPGESIFTAGQLVRPLTFLGGVAAETGKNVVELAAGLPELALQATAPFALGSQEALKQATQGANVNRVSTETFRGDLERGLGLQQGALEPKATKRVFTALGGGPEAIGQTPTKEEYAQRAAEAEREKYFPKPSLPKRMGEDIGQAITGVLQFIGTDILPVLPSPEGVPVGETFVEGVKREGKAAFERGSEFPAATAAFAPILVKAGTELANGDVAKAADTLLEKPATTALSMLPFLHYYTPSVPRAVSNFAYDTLGYALRAAGGKPAEWGATLGRWLSDPLQMETELKSAKAEAIFERARQEKGRAKEQTRRAVQQAIKVAMEPEFAEGATEPTVFRVTETGERVATPTEVGEPIVNEALAEQDAKIADKQAKKNRTYGYNTRVPTGGILPDGTEFVNFEDAPPSDLTMGQLQEAQNTTAELARRKNAEINKLERDGQAEIAKAAADLQAAQQQVANLRQQAKPTAGRPAAEIEAEYKLNAKVVSDNIKQVNKASDAQVKAAEKAATEAARAINKDKTLSPDEKKTALEDVEAKKKDALRTIETDRTNNINQLTQQQADLLQAKEAEVQQSIQTEQAITQQELKLEQAIREQKLILNRKGARLTELEDSILEQQKQAQKLQDKTNEFRLERSQRETAAVERTTKAVKKLEAPPEKGVFMKEEGIDPATGLRVGGGLIGRNPSLEASVVSFDTKGYRTGVSDFVRQKLQELNFEPTDRGTFRPPRELTDTEFYQLEGRLTDNIVEDLQKRFPVLSETREAQIDPRTGKPSAATITQAQRELANIVATGVIEVLSDQAIAVLKDPKMRGRVARGLADKVSWESGKAKAQAIGQLERLLETSDIGDIIIELPGLEPITANRLISHINEILIGEKATREHSLAIEAKKADYARRGIPETEIPAIELIPPQMRAAILDRVLPRVENKAFKQSLKESMLAETIGFRDTATGDAILLTPENAPSFADGVKRTIQGSGSMPFAVRVGSESQLGTLITELSKTKEGQFAAEALSKYERPSVEMKRLGFTDNDFIDPAVNSAYTSILRAMDNISSVDEGIFGRLLSEAKRVYTSRNISSAMNNFKSNELLFTSYYGLGRGIAALYGALKTGAPDRVMKSIYDRYLLNEPIDLGKAGARELSLFQGIRESGILDNTAAQAEGIMMDRGGGVGPDLLNRVGAKRAEQAVRWWNEKQDRFYTFGDNYFKFLGAMEEAGQALSIWDKLAEGDRSTIRVGKYGERQVVKLPNGEAQLMEPMYDSQGKYVGERSGRILSADELTRLFAKEGARLAGEKFVDYGRVPQLQSWLRSSPKGIGGLASLFTTWYWKMMDIPLLKKGIVSHFIESPSIIKSVSGEGSAEAANFMRNEMAKRNFGRAALFGVGARYTNRAEGEKMEKLLSQAMNWEKGAMPTTSVMISNADPAQGVYLDATSANFFGPSDQAARAMIFGGLKAGELGTRAWRNIISDAADAAEVPRDVLVADLEASVQEAGREDNLLKKELRRIYTENKAGQFVSPRELATTMMLRGGGPLFDLVSVMSNPKSTMENVDNFVKRSLLQIGMGGTNKKIFWDNVFPDLQGVYENASPARRRELAAEANNKLASAPFQPDRFGYPVLERYVDSILGIGWKTAYLTQIGTDGKTDLGKMGQWMKQYEDSLKASLVKEYEQKYNMLVDAGVDPTDPRVIELQKKYDYLQNVVDKQVNNMNLRIDEYFTSPKVQRTPPTGGK